MQSGAEPSNEVCHLAGPDQPTLVLDRPVQLRGSRVARWLLEIAGWRIEFDGLPAQQGLLIAYPHTSNWDFVLGMLAKWALGLQIAFWGKDSLFRVPVLGRWLRWLGGMPVDRFSANGIVSDMSERFAQARAQGRSLWLALAPEGTRQYQDHWRSGFYQLALQARVPVGLVYFDFGHRRVGIRAFVRFCGRVEADLGLLQQQFADVVGRRPELAAPIRLR